MKRSFALIGLTLAAMTSLTACNKGTPSPRPLTAAERAASLVELIEHRDECRHFRTQLAAPNPDGPMVDKLYHEAIQAKCLEKDV